jgi:polysaccharide transporter, PST family
VPPDPAGARPPGDSAALFPSEAADAALGDRSVRSGFTTVLSRGAQILLQLAAVAILARLLTPEDYGIQALVFPVALLTGQIANIGLQSAVIHHESLDPRVASLFFWHGLRVNLVVSGGMALAGPFLARLFGDARVMGIAAAWALVIYVSTTASVPEALLKRQLRFGIVATVQLAAIVTSIVAAVVAALLGAGYWALMVQVAVLELGRAAGIWFLCPWRPSRSVRREDATDAGLDAMRAYWRNLSGARVVAWCGDQADRLVVGAVAGAPVLGLYDAAKRWAWFPFIELYVALTDVAVASLSRVRRDTERYRAYFRNIYLPVYSIALPTIVFVFIDAARILHVLLGDQWSGATTYLRILSVAAAGASLSRMATWLYLTTGETRRQFRWTLVTTPIMLLALFVGAARGATGVAMGFAMGTCVLAVPSVVNAARGSPVGALEFLRVFGRPFAAAVVGALVVTVAVPARDATPLVALLVRVPVFLVLYGATWMAIPGGVGALRAMSAGRHAITGRSGDARLSSAVETT